ALPLRSATNAQWAADVAAILVVIGADGRGGTQDDARAVPWVAEHLQRLTARVAQRLAASSPVRSGAPARHVKLSLVERPSEAQRESSLEALTLEVKDLEQL